MANLSVAGMGSLLGDKRDGVEYWDESGGIDTPVGATFVVVAEKAGVVAVVGGIGEGAVAVCVAS